MGYILDSSLKKYTISELKLDRAGTFTIPDTGCMIGAYGSAFL
jgi:hypothetical protein